MFGAYLSSSKTTHFLPKDFESKLGFQKWGWVWADKWAKEPQDLSDGELEAALRASLVSRCQTNTATRDLRDGMDSTADIRSNPPTKEPGFITEEVILNETFLSVLKSVVHDPNVHRAFLENAEICRSFQQKPPRSPSDRETSSLDLLFKAASSRPNAGAQMRIHKDLESNSVDQSYPLDQQPLVGIVLLAMATLLVTSLARTICFDS